jgi:tRNA 2-thiouridine synthesizing protein A
MELNEIKADVTLDARGLSCPMPMLKTKKVMQGMQKGQIIEVFGTDPGSKKDLPEFAKKSGNEYLGVLDESAGFYRFFLKKG